MIDLRAPGQRVKDAGRLFGVVAQRVEERRAMPFADSPHDRPIEFGCDLPRRKKTRLKTPPRRAAMSSTLTSVTQVQVEAWVESSSASSSARKITPNSIGRSCGESANGIARRSSTALRRLRQTTDRRLSRAALARGKSIMNSNWIGDLAEFYGMNLSWPRPPPHRAPRLPARPRRPAERSRRNTRRAPSAPAAPLRDQRTSTANKIVVQALVRPDDIVLVDRNCHKSHHYGLVLAGAQVCYLDSYPLDQYSMSVAVPLRHIKQTLLDFRRAGTLDRVRLVLADAIARSTASSTTSNV